MPEISVQESSLVCVRDLALSADFNHLIFLPPSSNYTYRDAR